jgi:tetratricopeptide (TPR) repeat protein
MRRATAVLFAWAWAAIAASLPMDGEALFRECEFRAAANSFEHALAKEPGNARLHFWLGKSYARMAEVSGPLSARRNARKAQVHLETAAQLDPGNREFLRELFELYVDSPEYFDGGLSRATAMLERLGPDDGGPGTPSRIVADARKLYSGPVWALEKGVLRVSGGAGYLMLRR